MDFMTRIRLLLSHFFVINLEEVPSDITGTIRVNAISGRVIIDAHQVNYAYGGLDIFFRIAFNKLGIPEPGTRNALILGYGAGNIARILNEGAEVPEDITGVEGDKQMKAIEEKYYDPELVRNTTVYYQDAYEFVMNDNSQYDLIVVDLFVDDSVPSKFEDRQFLEKLRDMLNPAGLLFFNRLGNNISRKSDSERFFQYFKRTVGYARMFYVHGNLFTLYRRN